ncbi:LOW QUALITY PROTEIN: reverse transcriptase [Phytophthora palmivora]|uniref:Reverse transcriptase n=1 Tax=Phytophthora palmivora TaxID=4796 RepID=A0A2P4X3D3_9STRA|nr:LOW QUALITY PROTEIN: reverse transcriptase [Phytophthora palmivora]
MPKRAGSLRVLIDSGTSSIFVRQQSLHSFDFEEVKIPRSRLKVRLAVGAVVKTERGIRSRFSYKHWVFVEGFIVPDLNDKFDMVQGMPWLTRHDPMIDGKSERSYASNATESVGSVCIAHATRGASETPQETTAHTTVYKTLREHKDVFLDEIPVALLQDKGIQRKLDLVLAQSIV